MRKDLAIKPTDFTSSFLSYEKDLETILRKLFVESQPYSNNLKKLLVINMKDCLDNDCEIYRNAIKDMSLAKLRDDGYIKTEPKIAMNQHEQVKNYLIFTFDNFRPNVKNPQFRDCTVYIDGILNKARLSGIGTFQFNGCNELILDETLSGYTLSYSAIHGTDDVLPSAHGWMNKT